MKHGVKRKRDAARHGLERNEKGNGRRTEGGEEEEEEEAREKRQHGGHSAFVFTQPTC